MGLDSYFGHLGHYRGHWDDCSRVDWRRDDWYRDDWYRDDWHHRHHRRGPDDWHRRDHNDVLCC